MLLQNYTVLRTLRTSVRTSPTPFSLVQMKDTAMTQPNDTFFSATLECAQSQIGVDGGTRHGSRLSSLKMRLEDNPRGFVYRRKLPESLLPGLRRPVPTVSGTYKQIQEPFLTARRSARGTDSESAISNLCPEALETNRACVAHITRSFCSFFGTQQCITPINLIFTLKI